MRARRMTLLLLSLVLPLGFVACSDANQNNYANAALGTGAAIAAVGINRAITHDCWAHCSPGYLCNEESGLCELGECLPGCEVGSHCTRDVKGHHFCVRDAGGARTSSSPVAQKGSWTTLPVDAGAPADAGADAAVTGGLDAGADAAVNGGPDGGADAGAARGVGGGADAGFGAPASVR